MPGGGFATYDLVIRGGDPLYPTPWARDASASLLLTESETRTAPLKKPGMRRSSGAMLPKWRSTGSRLLWPPRADRTKPRVGHGPDFPAMISNLARNLRENRLSVLSAVLIRH